jgi:hypothetical protein
MEGLAYDDELNHQQYDKGQDRYFDMGVAPALKSRGGLARGVI